MTVLIRIILLHVHIVVYCTYSSSEKITHSISYKIEQADICNTRDTGNDETVDELHPAVVILYITILILETEALIKEDRQIRD
jgi:hypothetical protein